MTRYNLYIKPVLLLSLFILLFFAVNLPVKAAVTGGQASVVLEPETGTYKDGEDISMRVYFNTGGVYASGVAIRLYYPYSAVSPEVSVKNIQINSTMLNAGDWTCPTKNSSTQGGHVLIDIACANTSVAGFATDSNFKLADIVLHVNSVPVINPVIVRFDPSLSILTRKTDGSDILNIPTSISTFTIIPEQSVSPTLTPTLIPTHSPYPTVIPTSILNLNTSLFFATPQKITKDNVQVEVGIETIEVLRRVDAVILFDNKLLKVKSVTRTNLLSEDGYNYIDDEKGVIEITQFDNDGFKGKGILGKIEFEPLMTGETKLSFNYDGPFVESRALRFSDLKNILEKSDNLQLKIRNPINLKVIFNKIKELFN